jgi:transposase
VRRKIVEAIRAGNYVETAAAYGGIGQTTFYKWMERGESPAAAEREFREFRDTIKKALADAEVHAVEVVRRAMPENWQGAMTYLERRYPERWRRRDAHELTGPDGGSVVQLDALGDLSKLADGDLASLRRFSRRRMANPDLQRVWHAGGDRGLGPTVSREQCTAVHDYLEAVHDEHDPKGLFNGRETEAQMQAGRSFFDELGRISGAGPYPR